MSKIKGGRVDSRPFFICHCERRRGNPPPFQCRRGNPPLFTIIDFLSQKEYNYLYENEKIEETREPSPCLPRKFLNKHPWIGAIIGIIGVILTVIFTYADEVVVGYWLLSYTTKIVNGVSSFITILTFDITSYKHAISVLFDIILDDEVIKLLIPKKAANYIESKFCDIVGYILNQTY